MRQERERRRKRGGKGRKRGGKGRKREGKGREREGGREGLKGKEDTFLLPYRLISEHIKGTPQK